jgi:hypothetical protein
MVYSRGNLQINNVKGAYTVVFEGKAVSNNEFYSSQHWTVRHGIKTKFGKIFWYKLLEAKLPQMEEYQLYIFYNSKHDPSNVTAMLKLFEDSLKEERKEGKVVKKGWIYDDTKKYCKGVGQHPDETLPNNTFEFVILHLK